MKIKVILTIMVTALALLATSCQKATIQGYETGNPMPGSWYAEQVEYEGMPVDFNVTIKPVFEEGENLYATITQPVGRMVVTAQGEQVMAADILYCVYNAKTYTGKFVIHYDDDEDPAYQFTMNYYYDPKKDRFTVIEVSYNITFIRRK